MVRALRSFVATFRGKPLPWFLLGCFAFLYLHLFRLPWTPVFDPGAQDIYLVNAMRMLDGQMIYRDFFDFVAPGTSVVYLGLFKIFGVRAWIPNVMAIVLGVGFVWLTVVIARKVLQGTSVFLPGLVFLTFAYRFQLEATHHFYSAMAVLAALAVVIEARSPTRLAVAGALCGVATFFTQTRGPLAVLGLAVYLLWEARTRKLGVRMLLKSELVLLSSFLVATAALYDYFIDRAGFSRVVECMIVFLFKYSRAYGLNTWRGPLMYMPVYRPWYRLPNLGVWLFMMLFQPVVYGLCLRRFLRRSVKPAAYPPTLWDRWMLLYVVGLFLLVGTGTAPNFQRLTADCFAALIFLVWLMDSPGSFPRAIRRSIWLAALSLALLTPLSGFALYSPHYLDLPAGRTAFFGAVALERYEWLLHHTHPGEYFFAGSPYKFYLHLRDTTGVPFVTTTDFTRPEQVDHMIEILERHRVRFVQWAPDLDPVYVVQAHGDHLGPLRNYLSERYRVVHTFSDGVRILERNP